MCNEIQANKKSSVRTLKLEQCIKKDPFLGFSASCVVTMGDTVGRAGQSSSKKTKNVLICEIFFGMWCTCMKLFRTHRKKQQPHSIFSAIKHNDTVIVLHTRPKNKNKKKSVNKKESNGQVKIFYCINTFIFIRS